MSINKVMITGNLTRDAELHTTPSGTSVLNMGVAVNDRRRNNQTNEWEDYANFIDCTMFGKRAEALERYLTKGTKVAIEGRLHYSSWEDRNSGQKRSKLDVTVDEVEFMSGRSEANKQAPTQRRGGGKPQPTYEQHTLGAGSMDASQVVQSSYPDAVVEPCADADIPF